MLKINPTVPSPTPLLCATAPFHTSLHIWKMHHLVYIRWKGVGILLGRQPGEQTLWQNWTHDGERSVYYYETQTKCEKCRCRPVNSSTKSCQIDPRSTLAISLKRVRACFCGWSRPYLCAYCFHSKGDRYQDHWHRVRRCWYPALRLTPPGTQGLVDALPRSLAKNVHNQLRRLRATVQQLLKS